MERALADQERHLPVKTAAGRGNRKPARGKILAEVSVRRLVGFL